MILPPDPLPSANGRMIWRRGAKTLSALTRTNWSDVTCDGILVQLIRGLRPNKPDKIFQQFISDWHPELLCSDKVRKVRPLSIPLPKEPTPAPSARTTARQQHRPRLFSAAGRLTSLVFLWLCKKMNGVMGGRHFF